MAISPRETENGRKNLGVAFGPNGSGLMIKLVALSKILQYASYSKFLVHRIFSSRNILSSRSGEFMGI
ncbi:MAG: hypothetical protein EAZ83_24335 [Oscillatoriales cyanobacterium]|nr:MAG: hypothetical protein EAZ83_24335 [Oscillatoriales cyanobacterium]